MKKTKIKVVIAIVVMLVIYIIVSNYLSLQKSVNIDADYLSKQNMVGNIKDVLCVEKFTEKESVAIALAEGEDGFLYVFVLSDASSRYAYVSADKIYKFKLSDNNDKYFSSENTKFGEAYYCLYADLTDDEVIIGGNEREVYKFKHTIEGTEYQLGFYCGLTKDATE